MSLTGCDSGGSTGTETDGLAEGPCGTVGGGREGEEERGRGWSEADLDYEEELVEDIQQPTRSSEEDEVKVHSTEIIEEGELSSGEEGEIKGGCGNAGYLSFSLSCR